MLPAPLFISLTIIRNIANINEGTRRSMPPVQVILYRDDDGSVALLEWLDLLPEKAKVKCLVRIERLNQLGHEMRRPEADLLRDDIYELRIALNGVQYRILYFYSGRMAVVQSHGLIKKGSAQPIIEIQRAIERQVKFMAHPGRHTCTEAF